MVFLGISIKVQQTIYRLWDAKDVLTILKKAFSILEIING